MEIQALAVLWVQFPLSPLGRGIPTCRYSEPTLTARKDGQYVKMKEKEIKKWCIMYFLVGSACGVLIGSILAVALL